MKLRRNDRDLGNRGQELVEFALVAPLLMLLTLAVIESGVVILSYNTISSAAREGVRVGAIRSATEADVRATVMDRAQALDEAALAVPVTMGGAGDTVRVQVTYDAHLVSGAMVQAVGGNPVIRLRTTATMLRE
ncbi:MAG: pilus assembly protein [Chloroflexi bacterium]|nr:pilus assembly protein [Chloroflexota bacterium]